MTIQTFDIFHLALAFVPVAIVIVVIYRWSLGAGNAIYAVARMLIQLLLVGYVLTTIFAADRAWIIMLVMLVMVSVASWIALRTVPRHRLALVKYAFFSISLGGGLVLILVTQGVIGLEPWFAPRYMVPLAGMIFANSMNNISIGAERLLSELERGVAYEQARQEAFQAAMIPTINSLFAVGLVSLPGMMTGQILSGVSPFIAAQYQIVVMCMIFGSAGLSTAIFMWIGKKQFVTQA